MLQTARNRLSALTTSIMGEALKPKEHVLLTLPFPEPPAIMAQLRKTFPDHEFVYKQVMFRGGKIHDTDPVPEDDFLNATILCTLSALPPTPEQAKNLKFIHFFSAGTDHVWQTPIYKNTDIPLTTSSGIHGPMISEWVVMQILAHSHKQKTLLKWQEEHKWGKHPELGPLKDGVGQRLAVLGYGSIGRQTARVAKAMGMDVIAFTASKRKTPESKHDSGYIVPGTGDLDGSIPSEWFSGLDKPSLHKFLSQDIDILLISVPLTNETRHFLGAEEFKILGKKNALVVNISRGSIVVQDELIEAVKAGTLRGAALDVTDPEPLPSDSPLWDVKDITVTPHISGLSVAYQERSLDIFKRNLERLRDGKELLNVVDKKRGY